MSILSTIIGRGTRAAQPAASASPAGSLYFVTDESVTERSTGSAWESYSGSATVYDPSKRQFFAQASDVSSLNFTSGKDMAGFSVTTFGSGIANVLQDSTTTYFLFSTTASTNNTSGWADNGLTPVRFDHLPDMTFRLSTGTSIASCRMWFGISASSNLNTDTPSASSIGLTGFRYSTVAGDTNWMACVEQGSGSNATRTSTGVAVATSTYYTFRVKWVSTTSVEFYVNNALTNTITTTLPTVTTPVFPVFYLVTLENVVKSFKFSRMWMQAN